MKPTERFTNRADLYIRYRPSYPVALVDLLGSEAKLGDVADIGAGPGNLTVVLAPHARQVFAVEPNEAMREAGRSWYAAHPNVSVSDGTAEETGLTSGSVDLIVCGQAFHWFEPEATRREFRRILRPGGSVALIWNTRVNADHFLQEYDDLLEAFAPPGSRAPEEDIPAFFGANPVREFALGNAQHLDREGLIGRALSSSYMPLDDPTIHDALSALFEKHEEEGRVTFHYTTRVFLGQLGA